MAVFSGYRNGSLYLDPGAGNTTMQYSFNGVQQYIEGVDAAAADDYKVSLGSALGVNDYFITDVSGRRTLPNQPCFLCFFQNEANVTGNNVTFNVSSSAAATVIFNVGAGLSAGGAGVPATFTAPVSGLYFFAYSTTVRMPVSVNYAPPSFISLPGSSYWSDLVATSRTYRMWNQVTGGWNIYPYASHSKTWDLTNNASLMIYMTAGDTAYIRIVLGDNTGLTSTFNIFQTGSIRSSSFFSGYLVE